MDLHLQNQVAFIAGSSRGIGRAIAATLLDEGASIVLTGRDEASLKSTAAELTTPETHDRILAIRGDFADPTTIANSLARNSTERSARSARGSLKTPVSSRLYQSTYPSRSHTRIFSRSPRRERNKK